MTGKTNYEPLNCSASTQNQLGACSFLYDPAGNLTKSGSVLYTYDAENRLIATAGMSYVYDGDGNRIEKCTAGGTPGTCASNATGTIYFLHAGGGTLAESDLGGNWTAAYGLIHGQIFSRVDLPSKAVHYYLHDHLGSTSVVTDANGNIVKESDYYPYGGEIVIVNNDSNRYKFTGKERDAESGLDDFGARYFASTMGRFMTPDWAARATAVPYAVFGDPQTLNLYTYVRNDPVSRADADGHEDPTTPPQQQTPASPPAQAQNTYQQSSGGTNVEYYSSNHTATVTNTQTTMTAPSNGEGPITWTTTATTATFSAAQGHEGEFLGATTTTTIATLGTDGRTTSSSTSSAITYGQAVGVLGANNMAKGLDAAVPGLGTAFIHATAQDARQHPGKYIAARLGVASGGSSLAGAPLAAAALRVGAGAAALWEAVTHW